ncbi:FHA domain-containing protein [Pseudomonas sp. TMW 2.1634]|uniref:FHA domain-containing protein n=1 Tax=Pseudomonas TaxID=286 RepID=UPI002115BD18|nr:FHA domain-containing protein [Pseudomonas sp. TMW 2.1634]
MSSGAVVPDSPQPDVLFELRVLSGLHEGAALPLFGECWSIGAHQDADLELYDPGVAARHARLHGMAGRWTVQAQEGLLQDDAGTVRAQIADLAPGRAFAIGGIRLCVADTQSAWLDKPADAVAQPGAPIPAGSKSKWLAPGILVLVPILMALAWQPMGSVPALAPQPSPASNKRQLETAAQVHQQLLKMLIERDLGNTVRLQVAADRITLGGDVGQDSLALVTRMLERFEVQFETPVTIVNQVQQTSTVLPFRIVQIIGGQKAHVVLADGRRLFFGDEVQGLRLTAIDNRRVLFEGRQRHEVNW